MADKGLNIKTIEKDILNNPEDYKTTFMVTQSDGNYWFDAIYFVEQLIGKNKIKGLQIMTRYLMLVTMNNVDDMNDLLASVANIHVLVEPNLHITFIPVLPVPARVRFKISDIPLPLSSADQKDVKQLLIEVAKELREVVLSLEKVEDIQTGNLIVDALTNDLKMTHGKLMSNAGITYKNFYGTVTFIESFPVREECRGKYTAHSDIRVEPWK